MTRDIRLYLAWVVALVATIGSLYFSEVLKYEPCILCWYQRAAMYPQALILGIAAFTADYKVRRYAVALSTVGALLALFQNAETWGWIPVPEACSVEAGAVSCSTPWPFWSEIFGPALNSLNFILTIPVMSMIAFVLIITLLAWPRERLPEAGDIIAGK